MTKNHGALKKCPAPALRGYVQPYNGSREPNQIEKKPLSQKGVTDPALGERGATIGGGGWLVRQKKEFSETSPGLELRSKETHEGQNRPRVGRKNYFPRGLSHSVGEQGKNL